VSATATATITNHRTAVIDVGIDIKRSAEAVFDYGSDHTNEIEWNPEMRRVVKLTEGPIGVGTRYEMEFRPGRPMFGECVQFDRPSSWAVTGVANGMRSSFSGRVVPIQDGAHLSLRMEIETHGLLRALLPLLRRRMPRNLQRDIEIIKTQLEDRGGQVEEES
jgi:Polyketide cyclase / dehydrase and lipid transport